MEKEIKYESIPSSYAHCFNEQCVRKEKCNHHLAAVHCTPLHNTIRIINPLCIPEDTRECPYFTPIRKVRMAWGIKHLLDNVPLKDAAPMKSLIIGYFGRNKYYSIYRKECGLLPEDQDYIRQVFRKNGINEEPVFENYTEEYIWK